MTLTGLAFRFDRLVAFLCAMVLVAGIVSFANYPSQEEPSIPVKEALVSAELPGASAERAEALLAVPLEQSLRRLDGVKHISTTVRGGLVQIRVQAADQVIELRPFFERLRAYVADARGVLPAETLGPAVFDDYGEVAVGTLAITTPGFEWSEVHAITSQLRDGVYGLEGVSRISFHGLPGERVYVNVNPDRLQAVGLPLDAVAQQLAQRNVLEAASTLNAGPLRVYVAPTGAFADIDAIRDMPLRLPGGASIALRDVAQVARGLESPLQTAAFSNGERAVVMAVSMTRNRDVQAFGETLRAKVADIEPALPAGVRLEWVTFQADVVRDAIGDVTTTLYLTVAVVVVATVLVLGWRTGLLVGMLVPLTMLGTLLVMRPLGLELHNVSIAAFIIALGILVDNGTVVAEDISRRFNAGEDLREATTRAGDSLAVPLLMATAVAALAFSPPFFSDSYAAEFLRGLALVIAITLGLSWALAVTAIPLGTYHLLHRQQQSRGANAPDGAHGDQRYQRGVYRRYRGLLHAVLRRRWWFLGSMIAALVAALVLAAGLPQGFLTSSSRPQLQIPIELQPGTSAEATLEVVARLSLALKDDQRFRSIRSHVAYVGEGGPRFILGLNPPDAASNVAYVVVNLDKEADRAEVVAALSVFLRERFPEVRARPGEFSLGQGDPGTLLLRLRGDDLAELRRLADRVQDAIWAVPGAIDVRSDWEALVPRLAVHVDQPRAAAANVSSADIVQALEYRNEGRTGTVYREQDRLVPVVLRASAGQTLPELWSTTIPTAAGASVFLTQVADLRLVGEPAVIARRDLARTVTIQGRRPGMAATELLEQVQPALDALGLPPGYAIEIGGEIQDAEDANEAIAGQLPLAGFLIVCLFLIQFNSLRKVVIVLACFPFCLIGAVAALSIARVGFDFVGFLGVLALAGTIVSNAILVLERNEDELAANKPPYEALVDAAVARLRPIFITQLTTILGLVPFMLSDQPLWSSFNLVVAGGLTVGTVISLGMVPVLYSLFFGVAPKAPSDAPRPA